MGSNFATRHTTGTHACLQRELTGTDRCKVCKGCAKQTWHCIGMIRLLWRDKACPAHTELNMSWEGSPDWHGHFTSKQECDKPYVTQQSCLRHTLRLRMPQFSRMRCHMAISQSRMLTPLTQFYPVQAERAHLCKALLSFEARQSEGKIIRELLSTCHRLA